MEKLDRQRPYGEVHPPQGNAFYEQDGVYFDAHGLLLPGQERPKNAQPKPKKAEQVAAEKARDEPLLQLAEDDPQLRSQLVE